MNCEVEQAMDEVGRLQDQLARAIDARQIEECKTVIDELSHPRLTSHYPNALNWYVCQQPQPSPFLHVITKGHEDMALLLLKKGCDPHTQGCQAKFPGGKSMEVKISKSLFRVLDKPGFERVFKQMLDMSDKLIVDKNGDTVLHVIARRALVPKFLVVLHSKWFPKMWRHPNSQYLLPIHVAANSKFLPLFQILLHSSCSPLNVLRKIEGPNSCVNGDHCCEKFIKEAISSVSVNTPVRTNKTSALHLAAGQRSSAIVEILLKLGANINLADETGKTPLIECLDQRGEKKTLCQSTATDVLNVCKILIQAGANVNVRSQIRYSERRSMANDDTVTPLHLAAGLGLKDVINLLLNNGADTRQLSQDVGKIPLQFALEQGHSEAALALLHTDLYPTGFLNLHLDYNFNSLLHSADRCGTTVIKKLINLSCPLDRPNVNHLRPLDKAISSRNIQCVNLLLTTQPSIVNVHLYQDPTAYPVLHLAASTGNVHLCQTLLSHGADIYARAYGKHMAYRKAFKFNRFETAVFLCEQMSKPFTVAERVEILSHDLSDVPELEKRLNHRMEEIPTLVSSCLDTVRRTFIRNHLSFKDIHLLPVPEAVIKALKYESVDTSMFHK